MTPMIIDPSIGARATTKAVRIIYSRTANPATLDSARVDEPMPQPPGAGPVQDRIGAAAQPRNIKV
jgi:hypothetical protein